MMSTFMWSNNKTCLIISPPDHRHCIPVMGRCRCLAHVVVQTAGFRSPQELQEGSSQRLQWCNTFEHEHSHFTNLAQALLQSLLLHSCVLVGMKINANKKKMYMGKPKCIPHRASRCKKSKTFESWLLMVLWPNTNLCMYVCVSERGCWMRDLLWITHSSVQGTTLHGSFMWYKTSESFCCNNWILYYYHVEVVLRQTTSPCLIDPAASSAHWAASHHICLSWNPAWRAALWSLVDRCFY